MITATQRRVSVIRRVGWLAVASMLALAVLAPAAPTLAGDTAWATVSGYAPGTSDNNHEATWGPDCTKLDEPGGSTYLLTQGYAKVIVKAGSEQSAPGHVNTIFEGVVAGETVWADSNGSGAFDDGDKAISHVIACSPTETTTTTEETTTEETTTEETTTEETTTEETTTEETTTEETTTPSQSVAGETGSPAVTLPPSDTLAATSAPSDAWRMVLIAMAALLASVLVLTPTPATSRRR